MAEMVVMADSLSLFLCLRLCLLPRLKRKDEKARLEAAAAEAAAAEAAEQRRKQQQSTEAATRAMRGREEEAYLDDVVCFLQNNARKNAYRRI